MDLKINKGIFLPEVRLFNFINEILNIIREDLKKDIDNAILHQIFDNNEIEGFNYSKIAEELFSRTKGENPRAIETRLFFDRERAEMPTIHISLPGEMPANDGMGMDEGYQDPIFNEDESQRQVTFTRRFNTKYDILFTSDNPMEVIIMYHSIRAIFLSFNTSLQLLGFHLPSFSGQDLSINEDLIPNHIMIRALSLNFEYDVTVPSSLREKVIKGLKFPSN